MEISKCIICSKEFVQNKTRYKKKSCSQACSNVMRSLALKGKTPKNLASINANKKGSGNPMWGKHSSQKQKDAVSKASKKKWAEIYSNPVELLKVRKRLSAGQKGERGSNWKGGTSPINKTIRHGIEFRLWREAVFTRDDYTCQKCGARGVYLHPHHILNFAQHEELRFAIDNGITFCKDCHNDFHSLFGKANNNQEQIIKFKKI